MDVSEKTLTFILDNGITFVIAATVVVLMIIYIPKLCNLYFESAKEKREREDRNNKLQQQYFQERHQKYDDQNKTISELMKTITNIASQSNIIIENNSRIIESNTQVIKENHLVYSQVTKSLDELSEKINGLQDQVDTNRHLNNKILTKLSEVDIKISRE